MGFDPIESKTGRAISGVRIKEAAIHASTPCSSQTSTASATFSKGVFLVAKITRPTDSLEKLKQMVSCPAGKIEVLDDVPVGDCFVVGVAGE